MPTIFDNLDINVDLSVFKKSNDDPKTPLYRRYLSLVGLLEYVDIINGDLTGRELPEGITEQTIKGMVNHCIGDLNVRTAMGGDTPVPPTPPIPPIPPTPVDENNKIYYKSTDHQVIEPIIGEGSTDIELFGAHIISNEYDTDADMGCITFDDNVTIIGGHTFGHESRLSYIKIPETVTEFGDDALSITSIESINIPEGVTAIRYGAFYQCEHLKSIELPDSVVTIEAYNFHKCYVLESVKLSKNITRIETACFTDLPITELNIPVGVTMIAPTAFDKCPNLTKIYYEGSASGAPWGATNAQILPYPTDNQ